MAIPGLLQPSPISYEDVRACLPLQRVTVTDLVEDTDKIPVLLEITSLEAARLNLVYNGVKDRLDQAKAKVWLRLRLEPKSGTVDDMKAKVECDEEIYNLKEQLRWAEATYEAWRGLYQSMKSKEKAAEVACRFIQSGILSY